MILAPRTPLLRPSSAALVFDSASASAHTTRLAARDITGARSAGRVHTGPESAATWLVTASSNMIGRDARRCNRSFTIKGQYSVNRSSASSLLPTTTTQTVPWSYFTSLRLHPSTWAVRPPSTRRVRACASQHVCGAPAYRTSLGERGSAFGGTGLLFAGQTAAAGASETTRPSGGVSVFTGERGACS